MYIQCQENFNCWNVLLSQKVVRLGRLVYKWWYGQSLMYLIFKLNIKLREDALNIQLTNWFCDSAIISLLSNWKPYIMYRLLKFLHLCQMNQPPTNTDASVSSFWEKWIQWFMQLRSSLVHQQWLPDFSVIQVKEFRARQVVFHPLVLQQAQHRDQILIQHAWKP